MEAGLPMVGDLGNTENGRRGPADLYTTWYKCGLPVAAVDFIWLNSRPPVPFVGRFLVGEDW